LFKPLENAVDWEWEEFVDESEEESDVDDDEVFQINNVDNEIKLIHKELRLLSVGESFTKSDDEDSNDEIEETFQEEESATNFVINLGNKSVILKNCEV
jgi:hypothetical protein